MTEGESNWWAPFCLFQYLSVQILPIDDVTKQANTSITWKIQILPSHPNMVVLHTWAK